MGAHATGDAAGVPAAPATPWLFVGAGNMASALVGGLIRAGTAPARVRLVDTDAAARARASDAFGCAVHASLDDALDDVPDDASEGGPGRTGVVLAVKPQHVAGVCAALARHDAWRAAPEKRPFAVSIAAGVRIAAMAGALDAGPGGGATAIVRAMPNTPSLVGRGAAATVANAACDAAVRAAATSLFASVGTVVELDDEALIDAVTALSGSGPAYAFALMEHMAAAGTELGLAPDVARRLAVATVAGAGAMAGASSDPPATLRERVTSPGGTTAAALDSLARDGFADAVTRAMRAARARAVELGDAS